MILITPAQFRDMPWKNGLGTTTEIYRADGPDGEMNWRVSIAGVASDGLFSTFPGCDRHIMTIEGAGILLDGGPSGILSAAPAFTPVGFSGDWHISARLLAGPVRDFNLIVNRDYGRGELAHVHLTEPGTLAPAGNWLLLYVLSGQLLFAGRTAPEGHALLTGHPESATLKPIGGPARIALCRVWATAAQ